MDMRFMVCLDHSLDKEALKEVPYLDCRMVNEGSDSPQGVEGRGRNPAKIENFLIFD
jgi:hypothetical protein